MASQPTGDEADEGLEELDLEDAAVISHQSEVHAPARRQAVQVNEPSVVVAEQPADNPRASGSRQTTTRRGRRALEPTLLIRDRREAEAMRAEIARRANQLKRQRMRSTLTWVVAGLLAFSLGGLIALFAAKRRPPEATQAAPPPGVGEAVEAEAASIEPAQ